MNFESLCKTFRVKMCLPDLHRNDSSGPAQREGLGGL